MRDQTMRTALAGVLLCSVVALPTSAANDDGATIWGPDYPSTVKAMKQVVRALGVKSCLYCHVKSRGKVDYEAETEHKQVARLMKLAFVDSLVEQGSGQMTFAEGDESLEISARYQPDGDQAGIYLAVVEQGGEGEPVRRIEGRVDLPENGRMNCATCHAGNVHFLAQTEKD